MLPRSVFFNGIAMALVCLAAPVSAQLVISNGADIDMTGSTGSQIIFPDGTSLSSAAGASVPSDHGGTDNTVSGTSSFIGGGDGNTTNDDFAAIGGGIYNTAGSDAAYTPYCTIGGGLLNSASDRSSTVSGGRPQHG